MSKGLGHRFSLPLHANPENLDPCVNSKWIAVPVSRTVIGLWDHTPSESRPRKPIELSGHSNSITSMVFCRRQELNKLASSCADKIIVWTVETDSSDSDSDYRVSNEIFCSNAGGPAAMTFNNAGSIVAAGVDNRILLLKSKAKGPVAVFDIHTASVTGVEFCPHYSATLVSISDDRSFCVWDTNDLILLYRSTIVASAPFLCMSMNLLIPQVSLGSADGKLRVFDLADGNDFRQVVSLDIAQSVRKHLLKQKSDIPATGPVHVSKRGKVQGSTKPSQPSGDNMFEVESNESVLSVQYAYFSNSSYSASDTFGVSASGASDIVAKEAPAICVVSSNAIIQISSSTFETHCVIDLHFPIYSSCFNGECIVGATSYAAMFQIGPQDMSVVTGSLFDRKINVLHWCIDRDESNSNTQGASPVSSMDQLNEELSVIAQTALFPSSPLKSEMLPPIASKPPTKGDIATGKIKSTNSMNQPLTFKSKVKSSGYTQAPRTTMFKPETSKKKLLSLESSNAKPKGKSVSGKLVKSEYDTSSGAPSEVCDSFLVEQTSTAILNVRFSNDGSCLGCALSNKGALVVKSPYSKRKCTPFVGHNNIVNSVYFNSDGDLLLTASNDKTIAMWDKSGGDPIMTLSHRSGTLKEQQNKGNASLHAGSSMTQAKTGSLNGSQQSKPFSKEIKHAQFYYMDKFILLASGPDLLLYKYHVSQERDEIKRYQSKSSCRLVSSWQTQSTYFNVFAAVNTFFSHIVFCATSGKNLEIYDLNKSTLAHTFEDCHTRPPYFISINEGSRFSSQPPEAHNVIASVAQTDPVKIWDIRTKRSVQALQGHSNGAHPCQIAFTPCGNYLASGSEDKVVYMYDLRMGTFCDRLRGHNEVVSSVAFHPAQPLLVSGSINGKLVFFK